MTHRDFSLSHPVATLFDELDLLDRYAASAQGDNIIMTFREALERHGRHLKREIMTYAEQLLAKRLAAVGAWPHGSSLFLY